VLGVEVAGEADDDGFFREEGEFFEFFAAEHLGEAVGEHGGVAGVALADLLEVERGPATENDGEAEGQWEEPHEHEGADEFAPDA
jgi:hypothetical protein